MNGGTSVLLVCLAVIAAACTSGGSTSSTSPRATAVSPTSSSSAPPPNTVAIPMSLVRFGRLPSVPLEVNGTYPGPQTPHSLQGVDMSEDIQRLVSDPAVRGALEENGFVVVPAGSGGGFRQFFQLYESMGPYGGSTLYVTTDVGYHYWHLVFDKVLRSLEQDVFLPKLQAFAGGMLKGAAAQASELRDTQVQTGAEKVRDLFQVLAALLGLPTGTADRAVNDELALIREHAQMADSPILGSEVDYSLYTPRGHYTRNAQLTRYFLGMSLLGQTPFAVDPHEPAKLLPAVLATRILLPEGEGSAALLRLWKDIYQPTAFLVGAADDYTPVELAAALHGPLPDGLSHPAKVTDAVLRETATNLLASRDVLVDPETPSVRLMGTRFVLDSWILDQLLYPNVGTQQDPRIVASAVDVASAFGSSFAKRVETSTEQFHFARFGQKLRQMRSAVAARPEAAWAGTVYDAWLWALEPMWHLHGDAYPDYMRTQAWAAKAQQTGLGSYAELKHDTLLYTKQAAAEGEGPIPTFTPRHWVEPDPVAFARLAAAATLLRDGLHGRGLITDESDGLLTDLATLESFFAQVASDELEGKPISRADNERLADISGELEGLWWRTSDQGHPSGGSLDDDAAIVADIARARDKVVETGTGRIDPILVIVGDDHGGFQVAIGGVYSYYEFLQPLANRLTDEAWRQMLDQGDAPDRPAWEQAFLPG